MEHHPRLVVTGGRGQLGRALGARAPEAVLLDIDELDLTDRDAVVRRLCDLRPETIIHSRCTPQTARPAAPMTSLSQWAFSMTRSTPTSAASR